MSTGRPAVSPVDARGALRAETSDVLRSQATPTWKGRAVGAHAPWMVTGSGWSAGIREHDRAGRRTGATAPSIEHHRTPANRSSRRPLAVHVLDARQVAPCSRLELLHQHRRARRPNRSPSSPEQRAASAPRRSPSPERAAVGHRRHHRLALEVLAQRQRRAEPRARGDLSHRQVGRLQQATREQHALQREPAERRGTRLGPEAPQPTPGSRRRSGSS